MAKASANSLVEGLVGSWNGEVFTLHEELVWKLSVALHVAPSGKVTGEGKLCDPNDEDVEHEVTLEGRRSKESKDKPREVLLRMHGSHGWTWLLVLDLDEGATTLEGRGLLLEDEGDEVTLAQLVEGALAAGEIGDEEPSDDGALDWVDPGRFVLKKVVAPAKKKAAARGSSK